MFICYKLPKLMKTLKLIVSIQCDQVGTSLKKVVLVIIFKGNLNIWQLFGLFEKYHYLRKNCSGYLLGNYCQKIGLLLVSTSDHTVSISESYECYLGTYE